MGHNHQSHHTTPHPLPPGFSSQNAAEEAERFAAGQRSSWVSVAVNAVLTIGQIIIGLFANAQSLVADGMHSLSDMVSDFLVIFVNRSSRHPADANHPYGHGRMETVASLFLGLALMAVGVGFLWSAGLRLQHLDELPKIHPVALWCALFTLVAKEVLFRYQLAVAERVRSPMLVANAWHQRADAASSLVVAVGIGGSLLGFAFADLLAAAIVGFIIIRMGFVFAWEALRELIDTALPAEERTALFQTLRATSGVLGVHELRTRRMARQVLVDAHILVNPRISVSEGHHIAESARQRVLAAHPDVLDVLVHIDPEDDLPAADHPPALLPDRGSVLAALAPWLDKLPEPEKIILHYINGAIELEAFFPRGEACNARLLREAESEMHQQLAATPYLRGVRLHCAGAPR